MPRPFDVVLLSTLWAGSQLFGFTVDVPRDVVQRIDGTRYIKDLDIGETAELSFLWGCLKDGKLVVSGNLRLDETNVHFRGLKYQISRLSENGVSILISAGNSTSHKDIIEDASRFHWSACDDPEGQDNFGEEFRVLNINGKTSLSELLQTAPFAGIVEY